MADRDLSPLDAADNRSSQIVQVPHGRSFGWAAVAVALLVLGAALVFSPGQFGAATDSLGNQRYPGAGSSAGPGNDSPNGLIGPTVGTVGTLAGDLATIGDDETLAPLVGKTLTVNADRDRVVNSVAFWVGDAPRDMLVVLARDQRSGADRQAGQPPSRGLQLPQGAQTISVRGVVVPIPPPEEVYSWKLTRPEVERLIDRGAYLRADAVSSLEAAAQP